MGIFRRKPKAKYIKGMVNLAPETDHEYGDPLIVRAGEFRIRIDYDGTKCKVTGFTDRGFKVMHLDYKEN